MCNPCRPTSYHSIFYFTKNYNIIIILNKTKDIVNVLNNKQINFRTKRRDQKTFHL